ncbi:MAG TPA: GNAT family N-acetyltransferase [Acidimicrobiales bacterium]|nr:GNAT family N-acetyltransferase [Acidimicrobiales bacterium]
MSELTFQEFDPADLASWLKRSRSGYISERVAAGDTLAEAAANADESLARTFPTGAPAPGQIVGSVSDGGVRVGELWIGPYGDDPHRWWVWDVAIDETRRGQGLGRKTMILAEGLATANGATSIGLNVFARNVVARGLYQSLGYEETSVQMRKSLLPSPDVPTTPAEL